MAASALDWLAFSRRAKRRVSAALERFPDTPERSRQTGRGEGGDMTLAIDKAAEDAVFEELEALETGVRVVSEERGELELGGGGPARLVIDPIDGSLNARRRLPAYGLSIAVARGDTMADVEFGFVADLAGGEEWWAELGGGAYCDGHRLGRAPGSDPPRLEVLAVESAHPRTVRDHAGMLAATQAARLRMIGSIALSLCYVASARLDAMLSLRASRSVDAAAGQLIVREALGAVAFPDAGDGRLGASLSLEMRSRVVGAASAEMLAELLRLGGG